MPACLWLVTAPVARGDEFYYVLVFGSQTPRPCAKYSHTFAAFVRATGRGPCAEAYALECHTVSWLPETGEVRLAALLPERGRNLGLGETLHWAVETGQRVSLWGPYQVDRELYERALAQVACLESGVVCYKAVDAGFPSNRACNCIHAVSGVADGPHLLLLSPGFGDTASFQVARRFGPWIVGPGQTHAWVASRLGLDAWPLVRRDWGTPPSGPVQAAISSLLSREVP